MITIFKILKFIEIDFKRLHKDKLGLQGKTINFLDFLIKTILYLLQPLSLYYNKLLKVN